MATEGHSFTPAKPTPRTKSIGIPYPLLARMGALLTVALVYSIAAWAGMNALSQAGIILFTYCFSFLILRRVFKNMANPRPPAPQAQAYSMPRNVRVKPLWQGRKKETASLR